MIALICSVLLGVPHYFRVITYATSEEALVVLYCEKGIGPDGFIKQYIDTVVGNKQLFSGVEITSSFFKVIT